MSDPAQMATGENRDPSEPDSTGPEEKREPTTAELWGATVSAAARKAGLGQIADGEPVTGRALLAAVGGVRGIVEAVLPGLVFLVTYTITASGIHGRPSISDLIPALIAPLAIGVLFSVIRLAQRQPVTQAFSGLLGIVVCAGLVLLTGDAKDYYLPGFWTNAAFAVPLLVSAIIGWPLIGLAVGYLMGEGLAWRQDKPKRRFFTVVTIVWACFFLLRIAVQLPLYLAGNVEALGATRLIMGVPMYGLLLVITWILVRPYYPRHAEQKAD